MKERQFKETHGGPEYGKRGQEFSKGAETNARPQGNFGGKETDQSPSAPSARAKKSSFADRAKRLLIGVAGAAVLVVAVVLPARGPKADFVRVEATDTAIYYEIEVPETETGAVLVAENDFTHREAALSPGVNAGVIDGLRPDMRYTLTVRGQGVVARTMAERMVRTEAEAPVTQLLSVSHECTCNVDGLFHFTMEFVDEGRRWSDFSATLTDAAGNVAECVFTDDPHAPQTIGVVANGLVGNAAAFAIGCRDAQSGEYITLYEAQVKI